MRTIRRIAMDLNLGKHLQLEECVNAYAAEKQHWLDVFARCDTRSLINKPRKVRDQAVAEGYKPESLLQARQWKLALQDAADTWVRYWEAIFVDIRHSAYSHYKDDKVQLHYANWLLSGFSQFFLMLDGKAPKPQHFVPPENHYKIATFIRNNVRKLRGKAPQVKIARSLLLDADCYKVFELASSKTQAISIMSLIPGKRIIIPLKGYTSIKGNIRVILNNDCVEIHTAQKLKKKLVTGDSIEALDFGYTEAFTDTQGQRYGTKLGSTITAASNERNDKGKKRNKLRNIIKEYQKSPQKKQKIKNIQSKNLGKIKWYDRENRCKKTIKREINTAFNALIKKRKMGILITEDLSHAFTYNRPKSWNRKFSAWTKGILQERASFKALAESFRHEQVNPAYGSQECHKCGYVDAKNRNGDHFACLYCGHEDHADRNAALNYGTRFVDRDITRYTPYREVKIILDARFHRRLEAKGKLPPNATVLGRTSDTDVAIPQLPTRDLQKSHSGEGAQTSTNPAVNRRAKQNKTYSNVNTF